MEARELARKRLEDLRRMQGGSKEDIAKRREEIKREQVRHALEDHKEKMVKNAQLAYVANKTANGE